MIQRLFLPFLLLCAAPLTSGAQQASQPSLPAALEKLDSGATLRVRAQRQTLRGDYLGMSNQGLALGLESGEQRAILFNDVTDIWREGNYWKRGAIVGGITGTAILTGFGFVLLNVACEQSDGCKGDRPTVVLYSVLLGGGTGALVGGGLGYLAKRWIRVY
ncbi:MAG TPA: hypothetical protein VJL35_08920 [Gemmatimonadaceae bacterium]|jgi:hypothetical protein|nr:hypothetical protein [Gemmatimonadaceae bacterium]